MEAAGRVVQHPDGHFSLCVCVTNKQGKVSWALRSQLTGYAFKLERKCGVDVRPRVQSHFQRALARCRLFEGHRFITRQRSKRQCLSSKRVSLPAVRLPPPMA